VSRYAYSGRHRAASPRAGATAARSALATAGLAAGIVGVDVLAASSASADDWSRLRACESGGDYSINTGNGYYGAYQFDLSTWRGLGFSGYPHQASPATQDAAAAKLQAQRGWQPWPSCSRSLGLSGTPSSSASSSSSSSSSESSSTRASRSSTRSSLSSSTATGYTRLLTTALISQERADVARWQAAMARRGYTIAVDGQYGPQTAGVARQFQAANGLLVDGIVGPQTWGATF